MLSPSQVTSTVRALTTRLFRCSGWAPSSAHFDSLGKHDIAFWLIFGIAATMWYFSLFQPQRLRNQMLLGRLSVMQTQLYAETIELRRWHTEVEALTSGNRSAWERAARTRLGWLKPGEVVNVVAFRTEGVVRTRPNVASRLSNGGDGRSSRSTSDLRRSEVSALRANEPRRTERGDPQPAVVRLSVSSRQLQRGD